MRTASAAKFAALLFVGGLGLFTRRVYATDYPSWWTDRNVIDASVAATNDYAALNAGQLKWVAANAYDEFEDSLPGGSGTDLANLISSFTSSNNYVAVNQGQLKYVSSLFYDRLIEEGYTNEYPWTATATDDTSYAAANIGQVKYLLSFDITYDSDTDSLPDWWETHWFGSVTNESAGGDPDSDGWTNGFEFAHGLCPTNAEEAMGDEDGDWYPNVYEIEHGSHARRAWDLPAPAVTVTNGGAVTLQDALDAATNDYDVVLVLPGAYTNAGDRNLDFAGKKAMLVSDTGPSNTVIDCGGQERGFYFHSAESNETVVSGFTVTGGNTNDGGGVYCSTSSPAIQDCVVVGNAADNGGGIYCLESSPLIRHCSVLTNTADNGGGIHLCGSSPRIEHCLVEGNTGGTSVSGGGLDTDSYYYYYSFYPDPFKARSIGSSPVVSNCTLRGNDAPGGENIRVADRNPAFDPHLDSADWQQGEPRFYACTISEAGDAGNWSVHIVLRPHVVFENCAVINNACGGVLNEGGDVTVQNCTLARGTGTQFGAGIYALHPNSDWGSTTIRNTIIYDNEPLTYQVFALHDNELCTVDYSCYDPTDYEYLDNHVAYGANNTTNPPMLSLSGHIRSDSPCIDVGDSGDAPAGDIDGEARGGSVDMGCDEFIDTDGDTLPDWWEAAYGFDPDASNSPAANPDGDELSNLQEYVAATDPLTASGDTDGDGLSDDAEAYYWTDPDYWDSDDDLMGDGWEVTYGLDPATSNDASTNSDADAWTDIEEADQGTDPTDNDTDGDGVDDDQDADPLDGDNDAVANAANTTDMVLFVGDRSGSHSERYKIVVGPFSLFMSHVSDQEYEFSKTVRVPRSKTYDGYLESLSDDDDDGDYDADVTGSGITVDDPWSSDRSGRVLGGHHENSGFNSGQRTFTVNVAEHACDEESADATKPGIPESESKDPINTINGDVSLRETDVVLPAPGIPLALRRSYDSRSEHTNSPFGPRWSHSYDWELSDRTNHFYGGAVADWKVLRTGGGELHWFEAQTNGNYASPSDADYRLADLTNSFEILIGGRTTYTFGSNGLLQSVADSLGNALALTYTNSGGRDVASRIEHSSGQAIDLTYSTGLLTRVDSPTNTF